MAQKIQIKRSAVQGRVPGTNDLDLGELAINTFDGKLYLKKNDGVEGIIALAKEEHAHNIESLVNKTYTVTVPNFSTEPYIRIATLDLSDIAKIRPVVIAIRATTANGTVTETMLRISVTPATGTPGFAISAITAHSANSESTAEAGWVIRYARVSYTGTTAFLDINKYVTNSITLEVTPLTVNGWSWVEGEVSVTSAAGSGSTTCALAQGLRANTSVATSAGSADYCSYGMYGARSLSSTVDYTGQWSYIGYVVMTYNSSYLRGHAINTEIVIREIAAAEQRLPSEFIVAKVNLKATLASHSGSTEFDSFVPKIAIEVDEMGGLVLPEDFAAVCTATSTSSKTIRLYMRNKLPNDHYEILTQNRYGASYGNTSYTHTTSYCIFYHTSNQTPIATLPTPALGDVVYGTSRRRALAYLDESIYHPGNKPTPGDLGAATADHNHTLAGLSEKSYNSLTDKPSLLALGETSATAYRGDRGKTAYDHSQVAHAPSNAQANADITKAEIEAKLTGEISTHTHSGSSSVDEVHSMAPNSGAIDLSSVTKTTVSVNLNSNVTSIVLPAGAAGVRKNLAIRFTQDATGGRTVTGWPTMKIDGGVIPSLGLKAGDVTHYVLTNINNEGWYMHVDEQGAGLPMLKIPSTRRHIVGASAGTALSTQALTANRIYYIPFTVPRTYNLISLGVSVTTASAGTGRLGIYRNDGDGTYDKPGTLLVEGTSTINTDATGTKLVTAEMLLEAGELYWVALINTSAATLRALVVASQEPSLGWADNNTTCQSYMYESGSGGNLPSFCSASLITTSGNCPAIYLNEF